MRALTRAVRRHLDGTLGVAAELLRYEAVPLSGRRRAGHVEGAELARRSPSRQANGLSVRAHEGDAVEGVRLVQGNREGPRGTGQGNAAGRGSRAEVRARAGKAG